MKKCSDCIHIYACSLWSIGRLENTNADHCTIYETAKGSNVYYLGQCDGMKKDDWIPTTELLPQNMDYVLVWNEYLSCRDEPPLLRQDYDIGVYIPQTGGWLLRGGYAQQQRIIAWAPLPEPYKEVNSDL